MLGKPRFREFNPRSRRRLSFLGKCLHGQQHLIVSALGGEKNTKLKTPIRNFNLIDISAKMAGRDRPSFLNPPHANVYRGALGKITAVKEFPHRARAGRRPVEFPETRVLKGRIRHWRPALRHNMLGNHLRDRTSVRDPLVFYVAESRVGNTTYSPTISVCRGSPAARAAVRVRAVISGQATTKAL
jgi:hypothetical protein